MLLLSLGVGRISVSQIWQSLLPGRELNDFFISQRTSPMSLKSDLQVGFIWATRV